MTSPASRGALARWTPAALALALTGVALAVAHRFAVDWLYNDDIATLRWFADVDAGRLHLADVPGLWNNEHPVGAQFALLWAARSLVGLDMRLFEALSILLVAGTAALAARCAAGPREPPSARLAAVAACFALAFQPTQAEHLLWTFEVGWFAVNASVVASAAMTERLGPRAAAPVFLLCGVASLCSAQGAFSFPVAALHQALRPGGRARLAAAALLALGGAAALAHLLAQVRPSPSAPLRPDRDAAGMLVYAVEVLGGLSGARGGVELFAVGAALASAAVLLAWRRRGGARPDRVRIGTVLAGFSALCVAAFALGRHHLGLDWATASFHAAPLLVPFLLGVAVLLGAPPPAPARRLDAASAGVAALLLTATTAAAWPYGAARARLWAAERGYARWAACAGGASDAVAARGSGVAYDVGGFAALRPLLAPMCQSAAGPHEAALTRRPPLFDALATARPEARAALDALWQSYATDPDLLLAFKPWRPDSPARLLAFASSAPASDLGVLARYAEVYRGLGETGAPTRDGGLVPAASGE